MDGTVPLGLVDLLRSTTALTEYLAEISDAVQVLATVEFGREIVAARVGGDRQPSIVLTAGAHATEVEGTLAALRLIAELTTDHVTYIIPTRDPLGTEGFTATLQLASGASGSIDSYEAISATLRGGDVVYDDGCLIVAEFGSLSFAAMPRQPDWTPWGHHIIYNSLREITAANQGLAERLDGRRILIPAASPSIEGCGDFDRAWTAVGSGSDMLHLNRFFDASSPPTEIGAVRRLLDQVNPGLTIDLHAGTSDKFWLPYPLPQQDDELSRQVAIGMATAVSAAGYPTATLAELLEEVGISPTFFDPYIDLGNGVTPYHVSSRGEGLNFMDYCRRFGVAVGTEAGQRSPLASRVDMIYCAALGGIRTWERLQRL